MSKYRSLVRTRQKYWRRKLRSKTREQRLAILKAKLQKEEIREIVTEVLWQVRENSGRHRIELTYPPLLSK